MSNLFYASVFQGTTLDGSQIFLLYLFLFLSGSMVGYGIEVFFRRFFTAHRWVNPGFLKGPWLPIYGFGLMIMFTYCWILDVYFPLPQGCHFFNPSGDLFGIVIDDAQSSWGPNVCDMIPIAIIGTSLILLEFIAGLIFVRGFKVKLWDYSNLRGNIMGIICPAFDLIWYALALLYYYVINPFVYDNLKNVATWALGIDNGYVRIVPIFFFGVVYGILLIDFIHSIGVLSKIQAFAQQSGIVANYSEFKEQQEEKLKLTKKKFISVMPEIVEDYLKTHPKTTGVRVKAANFFRKLVFIDPTKPIHATDNYDATGRPVKEETDTSETVKNTKPEEKPSKKD